jgi:U3 small nucleolar RNA-associated protein 3
MATHVYTKPREKEEANKRAKTIKKTLKHTPEELESFFNSAQREKEDRKQQRIDAHNEAIIAARDGKLLELQEQESIGEDGKRAIGYQIMKNKGLTAKRKKENRNARVKKRKKYDAAKKKLKSVRAVYTGQQGPYAGELTGISKKISRSVKLN